MMRSIVFSIFLMIVLLYMLVDLPYTLGWGRDALFVIRGLLPIVVFFAAVIALVVGIANMKDKRAAKRTLEEVESLEKRD